MTPEQEVRQSIDYAATRWIFMTEEEAHRSASQVLTQLSKSAPEVSTSASTYRGNSSSSKWWGAVVYVDSLPGQVVWGIRSNEVYVVFHGPNAFSPKALADEHWGICASSGRRVSFLNVSALSTLDERVVGILREAQEAKRSAWAENGMWIAFCQALGRTQKNDSVSPSDLITIVKILNYRRDAARMSELVTPDVVRIDAWADALRDTLEQKRPELPGAKRRALGTIKTNFNKADIARRKTGGLSPYYVNLLKRTASRLERESLVAPELAAAITEWCTNLIQRLKDEASTS